MKFANVQALATIATVALLVDYGAAFSLFDSLGGLLQNYYGSMLPSAAPPPPPAPVPPPAPMLYGFAPQMMGLPMAPCPPPEPPKSECGCEHHPHHPNCLSLIKPCIHNKLMALKKKLIEKKLTHLLACCAQFNEHLCHHQG